MKTTIRKLQPKDVPFMLKLIKDPSIKKFGRNRSLFSAKQYKEDLFSKKWIICQNKVSVGAIRVYKGEVSVGVLSEHQRQGIAYNAINLLPIDDYWVKVERTNIASIKLFEKLGFKYDMCVEDYNVYKL